MPSSRPWPICTPKGVEPISGPLIHGFEGGGNLGGSGSRSSDFLDPDGNRLEIFTDMMRVPNGEEFPRKEYAAALQAYAHGKDVNSGLRRSLTVLAPCCVSVGQGGCSLV